MSQQLSGTTQNLINENLQALKQLFPEAFSEDRVDFEKLQILLGKDIINDNEKYSFTWKGKNDAIKLALAQTTGTLRPDKTSSKNWDTTENLYIEGDNLEVLRCMQDYYGGKFKMIYIDPPYNTGGDLIYKDNYVDNVVSYKESLGENLKSNLESSGRYHTDWLNMMFPRIKIAKNLLKDDGAIFISIDDNEVYNLKKLCDDIFGEDNFINQIVIKMSEMKGAKLAHVDKKFPKIKEYLLIYAKNKNYFKLNPTKIEKTEEDLKKYVRYYNKQIININDKPENWSLSSISDMSYDDKIINAKTLIYLVTPDKDKDIIFPKNSFIGYKNSEGKEDFFYNENGIIKKVLFLEDNISTYLGDLWLDISTININKENYNIPTYSNGQKPIDLIFTILTSFLAKEDLVLDFFAGSGTVGDAVLRYNFKYNTNNKFVLIQIPEPIEIVSGMSQDTRKSVIKLIEFLNELNKPLLLTEIGKERIRRAGEKIKEDNKNSKEPKDISKLDIGFKCFTLDTTNLKKWNNDIRGKDIVQTLHDYASIIKEGREGIDMMYEVMLKYKYDLADPVEEIILGGKSYFSVSMGHMIAYFGKDLSLADIKFIVAEQPKVVVFSDEAFDNNPVKINAIENLEKAGIEVLIL